MIWSRVRQVNTLRSLLREYYPAALAVFGTDLASREALAGACQVFCVRQVASVIGGG
jgi:hypothetical protein